MISTFFNVFDCDYNCLGEWEFDEFPKSGDLIICGMENDTVKYFIVYSYDEDITEDCLVVEDLTAEEFEGLKKHRTQEQIIGAMTWGPFELDDEY
ncbi:MAG: hypothetical protein KDC84_01265 [Crocinitomicaceae bacterium]|nr:hypothetical protein [Crocinitomicaceae bacterium]